MAWSQAGDLVFSRHRQSLNRFPPPELMDGVSVGWPEVGTAVFVFFGGDEPLPELWPLLFSAVLGV